MGPQKNEEGRTTAGSHHDGLVEYVAVNGGGHTVLCIS